MATNNITDLTPLVEKEDLGAGDRIYVRNNPLSQEALCNQVPVLEARVALITYTGTCGTP